VTLSIVFGAPATVLPLMTSLVVAWKARAAVARRETEANMIVRFFIGLVCNFVVVCGGEIASFLFLDQ
jgi:hypothetical protein